MSRPAGKTGHVGARAKTDTNKKAVIEALRASLGNVSEACSQADVSRGQFYEWLANDPEFQDGVESVKDATFHFVESKLHDLIKKGNVAATIFFLKCRGNPSQRYVERQEMTFPEGVKVVISPADAAV